MLFRSTFADDPWPEGYRIGRCISLSVSADDAYRLTMFWMVRADLPPQWYEGYQVTDAEMALVKEANLTYRQIHGEYKQPVTQ